MVDFVKMAGVASKLIAKNGRDAIIREETKTGDDWNPSISTTDHAVKAVFTRFTGDSGEGFVIEANDIKVLVDAAFKPTTEMRLIDGGVNYSIMNVKEIKPGPTSVLYILQARK